jgi:hydroxylamine reductase (hybrid-cluster protein)
MSDKDFKAGIPMLIPYEPEEFWERMRMIIREEIKEKNNGKIPVANLQTPGLTEKPLYRILEICALYSMSRRTTVHEWVKSGKLRKIKVSSTGLLPWNRH